MENIRAEEATGLFSSFLPNIAILHSLKRPLMSSYTTPSHTRMPTGCHGSCFRAEGRRLCRDVTILTVSSRLRDSPRNIIPVALEDRHINTL